MGGDLGPSMFIGSEAETEGTGGPDLPMKIISCHLFPGRKTGSTPPPPTHPLPRVGIVWIRARMSDRNFIFLHVAGLAIILSRDNWLICAFVVCMQKSFSRNWVKKRSCKFKYTRTVNERLFHHFFLSESKQLLR